MTIQVSIPGKIHLMGEHAVVFGKPAFLAAVDRRLTVSVDIEPGKRGRKSGLIIEAPEDHGYIIHAVRTVENHFRLQPAPFLRITVTSDLAVGYHLGSSAAVAAATVAAVMYVRKQIWNPQLTNQLAFEVEKKKHGNPSGGDNTAVIFGGFIWYRKELEFLKSIWQLPVTLPKRLHHFYLADTGRPVETTGAMVARVANVLARHKRKVLNALEDNEEQTRRVARAVHDGDQALLIDAVSRGQRTLEIMGAVGRRVRPFVHAIEKAGGAAKILGGGGYKAGVGYLLVYHPSRITVERICRKYAYPVSPVELGAEGIRLEKGETGKE